MGRNGRRAERGQDQRGADGNGGDEQADRQGDHNQGCRGGSRSDQHRHAGLTRSLGRG